MTNRFRTALQGHSWSWWLGQSALYLLLWVSLIKLPDPPSTALDPSWQMVLGYAAHHDLQHGADIVFTYGPLGYFSRSSAYMGELFGTYMTWQIAGSLVLAAGLYLFGRSLRGWRQAVYYLYFLCFGTSYSDAMHMNFITIFGLMLVQDRFRRPAWIASVAAVFAMLALAKFTNLMLCLFVVGVLCAYYVLTRPRLHAALAAGSFTIVFLGGWIASDQQLGNLPSFLFYGWELSSGYVGAMGVYESPLTLTLGLLTMASVAVYCALYFFTSDHRLRAGCVIAIIGAVIFLNWKHGFVRADGHVLAHYVMVLLVVCTFPALTHDNQRWRMAKNSVLSVGGGLCIVGIFLFYPPNAIEAPSRWNDRLRSNIVALLDLSAYRQKLDQSFRNAADRAAKPTIRGFVQNETVDHLGSDQGQTVLNQLNYTPRPAVQGYTTYTDALNRIDEAFYLSDRAPKFVVQRYQSIDDRLISLDDSLTLKLLFQNYDYVVEEGGLVLWERPQKIRTYDKSEEPLLSQQIARFGEPVPVPDSDRPIWAEVKFEQNVLGRLRQFLYKPPNLTIELLDDQGVVHHLRFIRAMGATGFILQPFLNGTDDLIAYQNGRPMRKIRRMTIHTEQRWQKYFHPEIAIELHALAPFTRAVEGIKVTAPHRFRMMNRPPQRIAASSPVIDTLIDGRHLLHMHPASVMEFEIEEPISSVRADFGIMPGAYAGPEGTLGVTFIIDWQTREGRTERLYSRLLDPMNRAEDRPMQSLEVNFTPRRDGKLLLRTEPGPSGSPAFGWSYWTDIEIR